MRNRPEPPRAPRRPHVLRHDTDQRVDDWYWLRDRDDPAVLSHLEAENAYTDAALAHTAALRDSIFREIKTRVRETDVTAPVRRGSWEYFSRTVEGREYATHCRRRAAASGLPDPDALPGAAPGETVLLDENALAAGAEFFALRGFAVSPAQQRLAYSTDVTGGERATLRFRDLAAGSDPPDEVPDTYYGLAWANDDRTVFYVRPDEAMRPWQIWRHVLGTDPADDVLIIEEADGRFGLDIHRARTGRFLVVTSQSKLTSEVRVIDADDPLGALRLVAPREDGVEYHVEHHHDDEHGDRFFVLTNADGAENFKLMVTPCDAGQRGEWEEMVPHRDDVRLEDVDAFAGHLVLSERTAGLTRLRVLDLGGMGEHVIAMPDEVYSVWMGPNPEFETGTIRYVYTSLVAPVSDVDYDLQARRSTIVKRQEVEGYDSDDYETHRLWATAPDGAEVPISIVHRREVARDGRAPLLLYGYGSYEISIDPAFSIPRLSVLERGVTFAIAHVRGGGELGRHWYEDGKLLRKRNTFTDFIACAEHLVSEGYTAPDRLLARGGSAGGLLIGAAVNLRPDLFHAVVAEVPFVDCLTTMLDDRLPLTITEWDEWGNPGADSETYEYMKGYSPYDNVRPVEYPTILATAGLNDPRVQYWEPAKWVSKLRATATGDTPVYLKTELGAGHAGPSGRYESWREEAFVLAFLVDAVGLAT